jgi:hypothetical protein
MGERAVATMTASVGDSVGMPLGYP